MDQGFPTRRRRAKAVAISEALVDRRKAAVMKVMMALAAMAVTVEALLVAQHMGLSVHP